jgi:ring-1,2-phenylacetyl-CoA epoxidase subunit PaaA
MSTGMPIDEYLRGGGKLTSPDNVPPRYRAELMRLMATFVDSALAGAAGFADLINQGPGIRERIAAARIVLEKTRSAETVLALMEQFGASTEHYVTHHAWTARVARESPAEAVRHADDMRLSVFRYPLEGWTDAVIMNVLMGRAVSIQLDEFAEVSYVPLADAFASIATTENSHAQLGERGLRHLVADGSESAAIRSSLDYWQPRVADSFGSGVAARFERLRDLGIRHRTNEELLTVWRSDIATLLNDLGLAQT